MPNTLKQVVDRIKTAKTDIAGAIAAKGGTVGANDGLEEFATGIATIPSGGGGGSQSRKDVNFYDYDGTVVNSYTAADFANLSAMPSNPTHEGLTAQGWNWSLADAKTYVGKYGALDIGQMYVTDDGKTRLYITLPEGRTSPILKLYLNTNSELDIDWGDGSTHSTFTSTTTGYKSERHEYSASGDYVIAITAVNGGLVLRSSATYVSSILWDENSKSDSPDSAYNDAIKKVEIGDGVTNIDQSAFFGCASLSSITIPDSVTSIGSNAFQNCYSLSSITLPDSVTSIGSNAFKACYSLYSIAISADTIIADYTFDTCSALSSITIPDSVTSIKNHAFNSCYSLSSVIIPDGVTNIDQSAFSNCRALSSITIPDSVTGIGIGAFSNCSLSSVTLPDGVTIIDQRTFATCASLSSITIPDSVTSIGSNAFQNCYSLSSITLPDSVTSIGSNAFQNCGYMSYIKFESITPPTVSSLNAWYSVSTSTKILVPTGTLEAYKTATNYPNPSKYVYEEY